MKSKILTLLFVATLATSCFSSTAYLVNRSQLSTQNFELGTSLRDFEQNNPKPTTRNIWMEGRTEVVELQYLEKSSTDTYIKTVVRFENKKLVSSKQKSEIVQPPLVNETNVECKEK